MIGGCGRYIVDIVGIPDGVALLDAGWLHFCVKNGSFADEY